MKHIHKFEEYLKETAIWVNPTFKRKTNDHVEAITKKVEEQGFTVTRKFMVEKKDSKNIIDIGVPNWHADNPRSYGIEFTGFRHTWRLIYYLNRKYFSVFYDKNKREADTTICSGSGENFVSKLSAATKTLQFAQQILDFLEIMDIETRDLGISLFGEEKWRNEITISGTKTAIKNIYVYEKEVYMYRRPVLPDGSNPEKFGLLSGSVFQETRSYSGSNPYKKLEAPNDDNARIFYDMLHIMGVQNEKADSAIMKHDGKPLSDALKELNHVFRSKIQGKKFGF